MSGNTYTQSSWQVGSGPFSITSGDFNGDGKADIATANYDASNVSVLTRDGSNTGFNTKVDFAVAVIPRMIITSDFNGDGKTDLATASHFTSNFISVLIRNSNPLESGGFTLNNIATPYGLSAVTSGDINGDGKIDLVSGNYNSNNISVFLRNSTNTGFSLEGNYAVGPNGQTAAVTNIAIGDVNGDGKLDVATTKWGTNTISVLLRNTANTGFNSVLNYGVGTHPRGIAVGDFNGDNKLDLIASNHESFSVSVLLRNSGNTGFNQVVHYPLGIRADWVVVGDYNGDGKSDLAVNGFQLSDPNSNNVFILINNGNGSFQTPMGYLVNGFIRSMTTGDYNGDGMSDLIAAGNRTNNVILLESNLVMWKGEVNNEWNQTENWWGKKIPTANSETVVNLCTICPQINNDVEVRRLWTGNATLTLNGNTITASEDASLQQTQLVGGGMLQAMDFLEFMNNTAEGNLILKKNGGDDNSWKGGNRYKGELQIINTSAKTITPVTQSNDLIQN